MIDGEKCPCGSGRVYEICCKPFRNMGYKEYKAELDANNRIKAYYIAVAMLSEYLERVQENTEKLLRENPRAGKKLLEVDVKALEELAERIYTFIPKDINENWGERFENIKKIVNEPKWQEECLYYQLLYYALNNDTDMYSEKIKELVSGYKVTDAASEKMIQLLRSLCPVSGSLTKVLKLDDLLIKKCSDRMMQLKYKFDKAIQLSLFNDYDAAKKIADKVMKEIERNPYNGEELYILDNLSQMYEMYYNFDHDTAWLEKSIEIRNKCKIEKYNNSGKSMHFASLGYTHWLLKEYAAANDLFDKSIEYEKNSFALIYKLDCLVEMKEIKSIRPYLQEFKGQVIPRDAVDFIYIVGNAAVRINDIETVEIIKKHLQYADVQGNPYFELLLKDLELALEKKSGKLMRVLGKLKSIRSYIIFKPQWNGMGIEVDKMLEDILSNDK